ncbi:OmpA family protein [Ravibacter arvi]|uniref:OmpA family protein n=1 Tax=Ravibacter arvi TaxID=2051041 RepID=A0ABP8LRT7_9BACT
MEKRSYIRLSISGALLLGFFLWSCNSTKKTFNSGVRKFKDGEYDLAIKDFQKAAEANYESKEANRFIAESYRLSNRFRESIPYFKKVLENDPENADARFQYAYALKTTGQYDEAKNYFSAVATTANAPEALKNRALREVEILKIMDRIARQNPGITVDNLPVNTAGSEFGPAILGQELIFSSSKKQKTYKNNGQPMLGIYKTGLSSDPMRMAAGNTALFSDAIYDTEANEGSPAFSPDGKTLVFARGNTGKKKGTTDVKLYLSRNVNGKWTEPRYIPVNDSLAWDGSPAFSRDGKTLYFASNRKGGFGGIDLYSTNMDASGRFSRPVNMGAAINTAGDEMFPYVSPENKLYFASDGHPGLGKLDLFVASRSQGVISVENMGIPFNSPQDDFALVYLDDESGFFSSNREGGKGDDDLYYFHVPETNVDQPDTTHKPEDPRFVDGKPKTISYFLAGTVLENVPDATVPLDSAFVKIMAEGDTSEIELARLATDTKGDFGTYQLEEGKSYDLLAGRRGFISKRLPFTMEGKTIPFIFLDKLHTDTTYRVTIKLDRLELNKTFTLENIYYDLDKFDIRADAAPELDKLVQLLKDNPTMVIELSSHTDTRGSDAYNMTLSQKRAESVVNYLTLKGIDAERMEAKGYGERNLIIQNAKTEEEHQQNRRTEFTILSY